MGFGVHRGFWLLWLPVIRVGIMWCVLCSYYYPRRTVIILRNTIINNSLKRSSLSVSDVTDEHKMYLGVVHQTIVRAFNRYLFLMKGIFHASSNIYKLWLLPCYPRVPFHQLASPPGFHFSHISKGNLANIYSGVHMYSSWSNLPLQSYWSLSCDHGLHLRTR